MKTRNYLSLLALAAAALSFNSTTLSAQSVDSVASLKNRAVASSPRAQETFPWLTRAAAPAPEESCQACCCEGAGELVTVEKNRSVAASPRILEMYPELTRVKPAQPEFTIAPLVEKGAAVRANPRTQEEFPGISRGATAGSAKGGASKLMGPRQ